MGNKHTDRDKSLQRECKYPTEHSVADLRAARHECKTSSSALSHRPTTTLSNSTQAGGGKESCAVYPGQAVAQRLNTQGPDLLPRMRKSSQAGGPVSCPASSGATVLTNQKDLRQKCKQQAMHLVADLTTARHECKPPARHSVRPTATLSSSPQAEGGKRKAVPYIRDKPLHRSRKPKVLTCFLGCERVQKRKVQCPVLLPQVRKSLPTEKTCGTSASNQLCTQQQP